MFAPILLVCVLGTDTCELMGRVDNKTYPTEQQCLDATAVDAQQMFEYFASRGIVTRISFKCQEDKNSI
jgi:hypothetical protein